MQTLQPLDPLTFIFGYTNYWKGQVQGYTPFIKWFVDITVLLLPATRFTSKHSAASDPYMHFRVFAIQSFSWASLYSDCDSFQDPYDFHFSLVLGMIVPFGSSYSKLQCSSRVLDSVGRCDWVEFVPTSIICLPSQRYGRHEGIWQSSRFHVSVQAFRYFVNVWGLER